jgi:hypothetical protein
MTPRSSTLAILSVLLVALLVSPIDAQGLKGSAVEATEVDSTRRELFATDVEQPILDQLNPLIQLVRALISLATVLQQLLDLFGLS